MYINFAEFGGDTLVGCFVFKGGFGFCCMSKSLYHTLLLGVTELDDFLFEAQYHQAKWRE